MFVLLDTCSWVMLAEDQVLWPIVTEIEKLVVSGRVVLIVPQIVVDEAKRHIPGTVKKNLQRFHTIAKQASIASDRVSDLTVRDEAKKALAKVMAAFASAANSVDGVSVRVMALLESRKARRVDTADQLLRARVVSRALAGEAPFHVDKNNVADALIVESALKFADDNGDNDSLLFVTENSSDFSDPKDRRKPHPTLTAEFTKRNIKYETNLAELLNRIQVGAIAPDIVKHVEQLRAFSTPNEVPCTNCDGVAFGHWRRTAYGAGLSWHMTCQKCRASRDTGEFYE